MLRRRSEERRRKAQVRRVLSNGIQYHTIDHFGSNVSTLMVSINSQYSASATRRNYRLIKRVVAIRIRHDGSQVFFQGRRNVLRRDVYGTVLRRRFSVISNFNCNDLNELFARLFLRTIVFIRNRDLILRLDFDRFMSPTLRASFHGLRSVSLIRRYC